MNQPGEGRILAMHESLEKGDSICKERVTESSGSEVVLYRAMSRTCRWRCNRRRVASRREMFEVRMSVAIGGVTDWAGVQRVTFAR